MGEACERKLYPFIQNRYGQCRMTDRYATFDYEGDGFQVELKSRRIFSKQYSTVMIGTNKIDEARKRGGKTYFLWNLYDGLFEWEFDPISCDEFETNSMVTYVPTDKLKRISAI